MKLSSDLNTQRSNDYPFSVEPRILLSSIALVTILCSFGLTAFANNAPSNETNVSDTQNLAVCADPVIKLSQEDSPCYTEKRVILA